MKVNQKIGFAVVGLGNIAKVAVLPAFAHTKKAKLAALVGRDEKNARLLARQFSAAKSYGAAQFAECLADPSVRAVYIATPQSSHLQYTRMAARVGKHVLCEKPLAATPKQSAEMVALCRKHNVLLMTAYRKYFEPSSLFVKNLVQNGTLGRIDFIHTAFSESHVPGKSQPWLLEKSEAGGGPLMDLGVYCVNTTRWLVDENPTHVSASSWKHDAKRFQQVEEGISFQMHFPSGVTVQGASTYSAALSSFIFIQGSRGWVSLSPAYPFDEERYLEGKIDGRRISRKFGRLDEFALEIDAFAEAILCGGAIAPDGAEGHRDMLIMQAIYRAAETGKSVEVRYA